MGVSLVAPGKRPSHRPPATATVHSVGPRASEWLPELKEALLPTAVRTVREIATAYDPRILRDERPRLFVRDELHRHYDVGTWRSTYPEAITRYALRYGDVDPDDLNERERERCDALKADPTTVGTGQDGVNADLDTLNETIVALLKQARTHSRTRPRWAGVDERRRRADGRPRIRRGDEDDIFITRLPVELWHRLGKQSAGRKRGAEVPIPRPASDRRGRRSRIGLTVACSLTADDHIVCSFGSHGSRLRRRLQTAVGRRYDGSPSVSAGTTGLTDE